MRPCWIHVKTVGTTTSTANISRMVRPFETRATKLPTKMLQAAHQAHQKPVQLAAQLPSAPGAVYSVSRNISLSQTPVASRLSSSM